MEKKPRIPISEAKPQNRGAALIYFTNEYAPKYEDELNPKMGFLQYKKYAEKGQDMIEVNKIYYAGPTRYGNYAAKGDRIPVSIDMMAAYARFLANNELPGKSHTRYDGEVYPRKGEVAIHTIYFEEDKPSEKLMAYFFNEGAFTKRLVSFNGEHGIAGWINILSSDYDKGQLLGLFMTLAPSAKIEYTTICTGTPVYINRVNLNNMIYNRMHFNSLNDKHAMAQATGWLSKLDKPSYYYMVQMIKYDLLFKRLKGIPFERIMALNTDGAIVAVTGLDDPIYAQILENNPTTDFMKVEYNVELNIRGREVYVQRKEVKDGD